MFNFLKDKLKETVSKFSSKVEESTETEEEVKEEVKIEENESKEETKVEVEEKKKIKEEVKEEPKEKEQTEEEVKEKKSFLGKIKEKVTTTKVSEKKFDEFFWDLEVAMLENNVASEVIEKIKEDLRTDIVDQPLKRGKVEEIVKDSLKESIDSLFMNYKDLLKSIKEGKKPFVIVFVGVNGGGKTTTIAKVANLVKKNNLNSVMVAADTFRAAAIQQLEEHGKKLEIKVIKHDYGSDPAAVAFDGIKHAESKNIDVVLIDTAGRLQSNKNLMDEMKKIIRVTNPDLKIFIGESITGNDCIEQAKQFNDAIKIDGIILTKADVDEKGGAAISVSYVTQEPIMYLGTGQEYEDLKEFNSKEIIESLGF
ncbi:MAG: signal recognition particle-docking protein FtsY [Candidatus Nanoarchaeia archaeon]|mgnify:CR=1 FL=1|jgi:fused signal recognition particle receptor|nr:signal recognition particle-docking protein FtsY [Candidatus Nanoarchaeia archaeon]